MKALLSGMAIWLLVAAGFSGLHAQTNAPAGASPSSRENAMISFLAPADQLKYAQARAKALAANPDLKAEGDAVLKQGQAAIASGDPAEKQAFIEQMNSHRQKLRAAMLKEDSTLQPVFAQIDEHISEMKAKQQGASPQ